MNKKEDPKLLLPSDRPRAEGDDRINFYEQRNRSETRNTRPANDPHDFEDK